MDTETFLENFGHIADASNGIEKLRELVLELAFQGKIETPNQNDEPVQELLIKLREEKNKLIRLKKIKKEKPITEIVAEEKNFEIPDTWGWVRLVDTGSIFNGNSISASVKSAKYEGLKDGFPYIATKDVGYGEDVLGYENGVKIPDGEPKFKIAHKNAVLICSEGGSAGRKIGITDRDICFGNKLYANELFSGIEPRFVFYFYQSAGFLRQFREKMTGIIGGISLNNFVSLVMPLPPEAEQKRIVAKVDQLMALCDQLETQQKQKAQTRVALNNAALDKLLTAKNSEEFNHHWQCIANNFRHLYDNLENLTKLRASIIQMGVEGNLADREDYKESSADLLDKIYREKLKKYCGNKLKAKIRKVSEKDQYCDAPRNWEWVHLGDVVDMRLGKMLDRNKNKGEQKLYLRNTNVQWQRFELSDLKMMKFEESELEEFAVRNGDLLLCEGGEPGRCAIWRGELAEIYFQKAIHRLRPFINIDSQFLLYRILSDTSSGFLSTFYTGATIKHLTGKALASYYFPLPPAEEQKRIVAKVDQLMALCDQLEAQLKQTQTTSEKLVEATVNSLVAA